MTSGTLGAGASAASAVHDLMRTHPDFPRAGILYRDLAPVLANGDAFRSVAASLAATAVERGTRVDAVAGVEARGFLIAAAVARELDCGVVPVRKPGKLPGAVLRESYELEYGRDELQLAVDALPRGAAVLLVDDVLATGGTLTAAARLMDRVGWSIAGIGVVLELEGLGGRERLLPRAVTSITSI